MKNIMNRERENSLSHDNAKRFYFAKQRQTKKKYRVAQPLKQPHRIYENDSIETVMGVLTGGHSDGKRRTYDHYPENAVNSESAEKSEDTGAATISGEASMSGVDAASGAAATSGAETTSESATAGAATASGAERSSCMPFRPMDVSGDHGEKMRCFSSSFPYSRTKRQRTASVWFVGS